MSDPLHVPARDIPVPRHLSPQAQAWLGGSGFATGDRPGYPALDDAEGWRRHIAASDAMLGQMMAAGSGGKACTVTELREGDALAYEIVPEGADPASRRVYLDIHGGALIMGSGEVCKAMGAMQATKLGVRTISVDYRMPPDHPFPVGLDDCVAFYRAVLRDHAPSEVIVGGGSAGGNLVVATLLKARDLGLPMPAAALIMTPEVDLTESGDSHQTLAGIDPMGSLMQANLLYAGGERLDHPYVSPLFGDFTKGFPPSLISTGTRDLFLSNSVRLHRKLRAAGIAAELHVVEAAPHGNFGNTTPEEAELDREIRGFCERWWAAD